MELSWVWIWRANSAYKSDWATGCGSLAGAQTLCEPSCVLSEHISERC